VSKLRVPFHIFVSRTESKRIAEGEKKERRKRTNGEKKAKREGSKEREEGERK
jgi:hypothetical protein